MSPGARTAARPCYAPCEDGDGCGCFERDRPGGVLLGLLVRVGEVVAVGVEERSPDVDGDRAPERAGDEPEDLPGKPLAEPGPGPDPEPLWPFPAVP